MQFCIRLLVCAAFGLLTAATARADLTVTNVMTASKQGNTITLQLPGGVPLEMVEIPAGSFTMGSGPDPDFSSGDEAPQHTVNIGYSFQMGKFEVTQAQWYAVMGTNPSSFTGTQRPVEEISWNDCQEFVSRINNLGIGTFRLPTEAEWEYACRAGTATRWYSGDDESELVNYAWYTANNTPNGTKVVGQKPPNAFGLYDMHGNVWEWVQDWYHSNYEGAPNDGSAWEDPAGLYRVLRGGGWSYRAGECRSADRSNNFPDRHNDANGVRLVRIVDGEGEDEDEDEDEDEGGFQCPLGNDKSFRLHDIFGDLFLLVVSFCALGYMGRLRRRS